MLVLGWRCTKSLKSSSSSLVFGNGYLAGPTWTTFSTRNSTFYLVLVGGSFIMLSTAIHVLVDTRGLRSDTAESTITYRFPRHDPSLSSKNVNASLSAFRPVLTHILRPETYDRRAPSCCLVRKQSIGSRHSSKIQPLRLQMTK